MVFSVSVNHAILCSRGQQNRMWKAAPFGHVLTQTTHTWNLCFFLRFHQPQSSHVETCMSRCIRVTAELTDVPCISDFNNNEKMMMVRNLFGTINMYIQQRWIELKSSQAILLTETNRTGVHPCSTNSVDAFSWRHYAKNEISYRRQYPSSWWPVTFFHACL